MMYKYGIEYFYSKPTKDIRQFRSLGLLVKFERQYIDEFSTNCYLTFQSGDTFFIQYITGTFKEKNERCIFTKQEMEEYLQFIDRTIEKYRKNFDEVLKPFSLMGLEFTEKLEGFRPPFYKNYWYSHIPLWTENNLVTNRDFSNVASSWNDREELSIPFLPTKIIFDYKKKKTTLLFGNAPYETYSSQANESDKFRIDKGFEIAYFKFMNKHLQSDELQKQIEFLYDGNQLTGIIKAHLLEKEMSVSQINKLYSKLGEEKIVFSICGVEHTIEIEHKGVEKRV